MPFSLSFFLPIRVEVFAFHAMQVFVRCRNLQRKRTLPRESEQSGEENEPKIREEKGDEEAPFFRSQEEEKSAGGKETSKSPQQGVQVF